MANAAFGMRDNAKIGGSSCVGFEASKIKKVAIEMVTDVNCIFVIKILEGMT